MKYIAIGNVVVFVLDIFTRGYATWALMFSPSAVLHGQVWRLVSFIFVPISSGESSMFLRCLLFAISTFFYYQIGTALERQWGTARFNMFYFLGVVLNLAVGLITYAVAPLTHEVLNGYYFETANMYYVNLSMFFSLPLIHISEPTRR